MQRRNFFEPGEDKPIYELLGAWDLVGRRNLLKPRSNLSAKLNISMRKAIAALTFFLVAILAFYSNTRPSKAQNLPIPSVGYTVTLTQDPTHCVPGATPLNWRQDLGAMRYCSAVDTWATIGSGGGGGVTVGTSAPAGTCTAGALYLRNDTSNSIQQLYVCGPANSWQLSSYLTGTSTPTNCAAGQLFLNTASGSLSYCSTPGNPGAWTATGNGGTVTVVGGGNLGSGLCVTGGGSTTLQTISACSIDASGNITTTGQLKLKGASSGNSVGIAVSASTAAGTFTIPGVTGTAAYSASPGTSGHCPQYASDGFGLVDSGSSACGAGSTWVSPGNVLNQSTTLASGINGTQTSITVSANFASMPATPFFIWLPATSEQMIVTAVSGTTWTVTRGDGGTTGTTASSSATVYQMNWSWYLDNGSKFEQYSNYWGIYQPSALGGGSDYIIGLKTPIANSAPWTIIAGIAEYRGLLGNYGSVAMFGAAASNGAAIAAGAINYTNALTTQFGFYSYAGSGYWTGNTVGTINVTAGSTSVPSAESPLWLKWVDDGTNWYEYVSYDNQQNWTQAATVTRNTNVTPTYVGLAISPRSVTVGAQLVSFQQLSGVH